MLPQPLFLNKLLTFLSNENLDIKNLKKNINNIFSKKDFHATLELNIQIMNIAKLICKSNGELNLLLPEIDSSKKIHFSPVKLELKKEIDINLNMLKDFNNYQLIETIRQEYKHNTIKELEILTPNETIKILIILNGVPKFLKSIYKECSFKDYGLTNYLEFDDIWDFCNNNTRYFALITPFGAQKIKFFQEDMEYEDELNTLSIELDKK